MGVKTVVVQRGGVGVEPCGSYHVEIAQLADVDKTHPLGVRRIVPLVRPPPIDVVVRELCVCQADVESSERCANGRRRGRRGRRRQRCFVFTRDVEVGRHG